MKSTVTALLACVLLTTAACGGGTSTSSDPNSGQLARGQTFTMVLPTDPGSLDPAFTTLTPAQQVISFAYDSLIAVDASGKILPNLASKWKGTATSATFTLRDGITCSDGTKLTASDVADNINFVANPKNKSVIAGLTVQLGAKATANDAAGTVTIDSSAAPDSFLVRNVGTLPIVCPAGMADRSILKQGSSGTGMYTVTKVVPNDSYTLTLRDGYDWGPGAFTSAAKGLPKTVIAKVVPNETTAANLLLSGDVNAATVGGPDRQRLTSSGLFHADTVASTAGLFYNHVSGEPTSDEAVRRALTQALDLGQLGQIMTDGTGVPATGLVSPGGPCPKNTVAGNVPTHDLAAAEAGLEAAGWRLGSDGMRAKDGQELKMSLVYLTSSGETAKAGAEFVDSVWSDLGVDVKLLPMTDVQLGKQVIGGQGEWGAGFFPSIVSVPSAIVPFLSGPTPPDGVNVAHIDNAGYNEHVAKAAKLEGSKGCPDWEAAEESLFKHVDLVYFVNTVTPTFGKNAEFDAIGLAIVPSSIRMFAN